MQPDIEEIALATAQVATDRYREDLPEMTHRELISVIYDAVYSALLVLVERLQPRAVSFSTN